MGSLNGKKVCVTGRLAETRDEVQERLEGLGATIHKSVGKTTDLLVAGSRAGSKLAKAEKKGIPVLGQDELDSLLSGKSLAEVLGDAAPKSTSKKAAPKKEAKAAPKEEAKAAPAGKPHAGQTFVLTGELDIERSDAKRRLVALGARVTGSVSGKTTALLCGDEPGQSKIAKAEKKTIPVVDKAGVERLLNGEPLDALSGPAPAKAETSSERTPLPAIPERADGPYTMNHPGTDQVQYEGQFEGGRMVGTWKGYHPNGQLQWQVGWIDGKRQGPMEAWHENGEKHYTGEYVDDEQHGEWTYWYDDGAYFQTYHFDDGLKTGDYVCDERDGSPRARGQFEEGKLHGPWEWRNQKNHELVRRGYDRGAFTGMSEAWYYGGQLAYRKEYRGGGLCGVFEAYDEDGKPKMIGEYASDRSGLIRMETYDADGHKTVEEGTEKKLAEKLLASESRLEKLAARLKKAKDEFKKDDVLEKAAGDYSLKYPLLLHLFRNDIYDLGADWQLWRHLAENTHLLTGDDVAKLLKTAKPKKDIHCPHIPGWPGSLDEMVMRVYPKDPEPIEAVLPELKGKLATGVKFCLARFGKEVTLGDQAKGLADKTVNDYGVGDRILWPNEEGTEVDRIDLYEGPGRNEPSEHFGRLLELLTDSDRFEEAVMDAVMKRCAKEHSSDIDIARLGSTLRRASVDQLVTIFDNATLGDQTIDATRKLFFEVRDDDAETVTEIALAMKERGMRRWPPVACAILKRREAGLSIPDELLDVLPLDGVSVSMSWVDQAIRDALGTDQKAHYDLQAVADAVVFEGHDAPGCPRHVMLVEALRTLQPAQLKKKLEARLEEQYGKQNAAPYLFLLDDEDFWKSAIEVIAESGGGGHNVAFGLGLLPLKALPLIEAGRKKAEKKHQDSYDRAMLLCVTRALERGETLTDDQLERIRFDLGGKYDWNYVMPILRKAITVLPREQGEKVLLKGLTSANVTTFAHAFRFVGAHPSEKVLATAMHGLLDREMKLKSESNLDVQAGLQSLPTVYMNERRAYVKWLLENDGGKKLKNAFKNAIGDYQAFDALEREIAEGGKEVAKELDKVDKVVVLAERARKASKGGTQVIYALRNLEEAPAKATLNRTGGKPPGIDAEAWPTHDDEPMVHLFTLDLETMPELKSPKTDNRSVSFFCYSPDHNEAWTPGNDQTALLKAASEQVGQDHEPPEEAEVRPQGHFEAVHIEVPSDVWFTTDGVLGELRGAIYQLGARVLGEPLWLQGDEGGGAGFVMQFDESFVGVNLGDMGIMYVFSDGGFWQCH